MSLRAILDQDGRIEDLSDNLRELAGFRAGEGAHMPVWEMSLWNDEGRAWLREAVSVARTGGSPSNELDAAVDGGGIKQLDLSLGPICGDTGDVSKLWLEATELAQGRQQTLALEDLRETGTFGELARLAAHDFNNLLAGIGGNLELIAKRQELDETSGKRMERALRGVFRGRALTDLMDVFMHEDGGMQAVDIEATVAAVTELCKGGLDTVLDVVMESADGLWRCRADPDHLATALLNLMINAYDTLATGTPILVRADNRTFAGEARKSVPNLSAGDYLVLRISHGNPDDLSTDTDAISLADARVRGGHLGLGLRMVLAFARQSSGDLVLADKPGRGTVAWLYLPRAREPADV